MASQSWRYLESSVIERTAQNLLKFPTYTGYAPREIDNPEDKSVKEKLNYVVDSVLTVAFLIQSFPDYTNKLGIPILKVYINPSTSDIYVRVSTKEPPVWYKIRWECIDSCGASLAYGMKVAPEFTSHGLVYVKLKTD
jgi:hypothetical protein